MEPTDEYDVETNTVMALAWLYDCGKRGENNFEVPWDWRIAYERNTETRRDDDRESIDGRPNNGRIDEGATSR
jgi:hypothetical protein